jgi:YesN/AraC family two-component response regulator
MNEASEHLSVLRVMLVEDDPTVSKLLQMMLRALDVELVFTACDGAEALSFLSRNEGMVNTVLCDWNMPKMTGIELLRQVRSVDPDLQFVMVSGHATPEHVSEARGLNVNAFIAKPFYVETVREQLEIVADRLRA